MIRTNPRHKFGAIRTDRDGISFPSKLEAARYHVLKNLKKSGAVVMFLRQPLFDLPGGVQYRADFLVFWEDGSCTVEDCKGFETKDFVIKKKLVEAHYPVEIQIIKKPLGSCFSEKIPK